MNAGGQTQGTITVTNTGNMGDTNVVITAQLPSGFTTEGNSSKTFPTIASLPPGQSQSYTFPLDVDSSVTSGSYPVNGNATSAFYGSPLFVQANVNVLTPGGGGGSTPTPTPTPSPTGQVAGVSDNSGGQVLGASDVLPEAGFGFVDRIFLSLMISLAATGMLLMTLGARLLPARLEEVFVGDELAKRLFGGI